eukprot:224444-Chlamydomonas_euryale.AAC.2
MEGPADQGGRWSLHAPGAGLLSSSRSPCLCPAGLPRLHPTFASQVSSNPALREECLRGTRFVWAQWHIWDHAAGM